VLLLVSAMSDGIISNLLVRWLVERFNNFSGIVVFGIPLPCGNMVLIASVVY
jgi:hypothetical protein